ncbi:hypothetical protein K466DRAFT_584617 [Polyporus arcularius HHB13444]|uniref:Aminoglycoside phosphotransferase domain-containing protein n=1 Tax=Polyporus arcularius HHB13444 TaxID=1314778 RepID=A0A5C3PI33_9APHY|nr:hypothetical protein K466DRAFT_584617 [Polyporus arcularius HHB13444]
MVDADGEHITGIIDWGNAGFYPSYWEYSRMHDANFCTLGWEKILGMVFPEPRRQTEIGTVRTILLTIEDHL